MELRGHSCAQRVSVLGAVKYPSLGTLSPQEGKAAKLRTWQEGKRPTGDCSIFYLLPSANSHLDAPPSTSQQPARPFPLHLLPPLRTFPNQHYLPLRDRALLSPLGALVGSDGGVRPLASNEPCSIAVHARVDTAG